MSSVSLSLDVMSYIYRRTSKKTYYDNFLFTLHSTVENTNLTVVKYNFYEIKIIVYIYIYIYICINVYIYILMYIYIHEYAFMRTDIY